MRRAYWRPPTALELQSLPGYTLDDFPEPPPFDVWDENWDVLHLFLLYRNQWIFTMAGPVALNMQVFHHALDRKKIPEDEYDRFILDLLIIEPIALSCITE